MDSDNDELAFDSGDDEGFELGPRLIAPTAKLYTTQQLHGLIHEGIIDLNPTYQRDVVWPEQKQIKVLDSIWRNYYVPPVVFAVYYNDEGLEVRHCVDGKQRLTSIQKFFDGQIPYKHWQTGKSWWYTRASSQRNNRQEVPVKWKHDFAAKTITCVEYRGLSHTLERDIFQRVQLGMPLTAAEKLQAISSPKQELISELEGIFIAPDDGLTQLIDVDVGRGRDFQLIAQLVYCCQQYPERAQPSAKNLERWLMDPAKPSSEFINTMNSVLRRFWFIAKTKELNYGFKSISKRVSPAEFVFTGVLLYVLRALTQEEQAEAINNMRNHIRAKYQDIRMRNDIIRDLWTFIDKVLDQQDTTPPPKKATGSKKGKKVRARDEDMDTEDEEYKPKKQAKRK
ncbi:hypothetical protein TRAPUB_14134 [Trametes pubescens]|uniref:GmrSD restriction endonucleases N-terminal domain-containing protein n=1 Tax=Trametes pubescens TaxID=154538 RepID=A0A1M2VPA1_TRAPU|nr:hypothetical protein TRAPUB_14134 [Trametes pubescens]